jgi:pimeloyl-ACP methyl ester carboxylesterase
VPVLQWAACGGGFECASVAVPLDYDHPRSVTTSLALIRLPATDQRHRIGSLLINPGGPGASGVDRVRQGARQMLPPAVRARFDVVGFDPRGVAASSPIRCFPSVAAQSRFFADVPLFPKFPVGRREQVAFIAKMAELGGICLRHNAEIMQHMSTANVARDMDLLRRALGDPALTFYGASYGSYLGNTYANLFPATVRALVLDSVVEPVAWATGRGQGFTQPLFIRERSDQGAHATLQQFLRLCDLAGPRCAFAAGNPTTKLDRLLERARKAPIIVPTPQGPQPVSYAEIVAPTLNALFEPDSWPALAEDLQLLYDASNRSTMTAPVAGIATGAGPASGGYDNTLESFLSVICSDTNHPRDPFVWPRAAASADRHFAPFGAPWAWDSEACATWPARDHDRYSRPFTHRTAAPVLLIGTRFDPASRYQNAKIVARELPRARLLTLNGWGHVALGKSSCISAHVAGYLLGGTLPPPGTSCKPDRRPFQEEG